MSTFTTEQATQNPLADFTKATFILKSDNEFPALREFLETIGLHPMDLGVPRRMGNWSSLQEETFYSRLETSMLPYEGEKTYSFDELKKIYMAVANQADQDIADFQIFIENEHTGWDLGGDWGSENARFEFLNDAVEAADFLAKEREGAKFAVFTMEGDEREDNIPSYEAFVDDSPYCGYVITPEGSIFLQIPDEESKHGFYLASDDQTWDGGIGIASQWEAISEGDPRISEEDKERLQWILDEAR